MKLFFLDKTYHTISRQVVFLLMLLWGTCVLSAQELRTEICIDFRLNSHTIDATYMNNATRLDEIMEAIGKLRNDTTQRVIQLTFSGVSSPEGNSQINQRLAKERMEALEDYVRSHISLPDSLVIYHDDHYIPWQYLITEVETSNLNQKEDILTILRSPKVYIPYRGNTTIDSRVPALQRLDGGRVWRILNERYFDKMRNACAILLTVQNKKVEDQVLTPDPSLEPVSELLPTPDAEPVDTIGLQSGSVVTSFAPGMPKPRSDVGIQRLYLKTNAIGWGMLISNLAVEADFAKHWSATLPIYYSAMNYFTSTVKFRTLCFQPEVRYWLNEDNQGWFGGAHLGLAWFNYAKGGDWRYQDHNRNTPLWGAGVSGGYRKAISRNQRWFLEFSLGTGVYKLHYDIFYNEPDGRRVDTRKRTFFGIDQAAVTLAYRFDFKQKGGKQ